MLWFLNQEVWDPNLTQGEMIKSRQNRENISYNCSSQKLANTVVGTTSDVNEVSKNTSNLEEMERRRRKGTHTSQ